MEILFTIQSILILWSTVRPLQIMAICSRLLVSIINPHILVIYGHFLNLRHTQMLSRIARRLRRGIVVIVIFNKSI
uniref:Uncharacterized protein n=1 Tax=Arundo donax TaxID=35708 RepID=A0A0A9ETT0_ARUDO